MTSSYSRTHVNVLLEIQVYPVDRAYQWNVCKGTHDPIGTHTGATLMLAAAGNTCQFYTTTLLSGVVGSLICYYIPLFCIKWLYFISTNSR